MIRSVVYLAMHTSPLEQPGRGDAGGMNVYLRELCRTMSRRGVDAAVFTRRRRVDLPDEVAVDGYRVVHVDAGPPRRMPVADLAPYVADFAREVCERLATDPPSLLHSHYWLSGWAAVLVKDELGLPLANSFHTLGRVKDLYRAPGEAPSSPLRLLTEEEVIARADCVIAATPYEFDDLLEHYGASPERLCVSPPGVDHAVFHPGDRAEARRRLGLGDGPLVLFVGRIQAHKGPDLALRAFARLRPGPDEREPRMVIIGGPSGRAGDDDLASLHRLARDLRVPDRVRFVPPRPHAVLAEWYRAADVLVMPSRSESFGLVAAEAQACGLPVVASRVGGLPSIVSDRESGLLVDGFDPADLASALEAVLHDPAFARRLATTAVAFSSRFSWEATADRLFELYGGIVFS